jgi:hypothetical protein
MMMKPLPVTALLLLGLVVAGRKAEADLLTPLTSSFALTAEAQAGYAPVDTDTDSQSQGSTINTLSVAVSAYSSYLFSPFETSVLVTGNGSSMWTTPSQGQVTFTDIGWTTAHANGLANLSSNTGWTYTFTSNVTGSFVIDYNVTAQGTSSIGPPIFSGLNGFYIYEGLGSTPPGNATLETGLNTSGEVALPITAGNIYTVEIQPFANIQLGIGTRDVYTGGTFDFGVQSQHILQTVPELSSMSMTIIITALVGVAIAVKRHL